MFDINVLTVLYLIVEMLCLSVVPNPSRNNHRTTICKYENRHNDFLIKIISNYHCKKALLLIKVLHTVHFSKLSL